MNTIAAPVLRLSQYPRLGWAKPDPGAGSPRIPGIRAPGRRPCRATQSSIPKAIPTRQAAAAVRGADDHDCEGRRGGGRRRLVRMASLGQDHSQAGEDDIDALFEARRAGGAAREGGTAGFGRCHLRRPSGKRHGSEQCSLPERSLSMPSHSPPEKPLRASPEGEPRRRAPQGAAGRRAGGKSPAGRRREECRRENPAPAPGQSTGL